MTIKAIVFDIGGVLERIEDPGLLTERWHERLGMARAEFDAALATVDPDHVIVTGGLSEAEYTSRYAAALGLSPTQQREFMADLWDWYCGELDAELTASTVIMNLGAGAQNEDLRPLTHSPRDPHAEGVGVY